MAERPLVHKFGGAVLRSPEGFAAMAQRLHESDGQPLLVVISALGRVTRELEQAAADAERGEYGRALERLHHLVEQHQRYAAQLLGSQGQQHVATILDETAAQLQGYLEGIAITGELTPRTLDLVRSFGERWALALVAAFLRECGFPVVAVDATELLCTDARHGMARPLLEQTAQSVERSLRPLLRPGQVVLTQGFIARSLRGEITTMGQESSALTAVLLAALVGAEELQVWTDVPGVRTCDPSVVPEAELLPALSYGQARRIAQAGLRLLYPAAIACAERWNICLRIRSAFTPEAGETVVSSVPGELVPMIIGREGVWLLAGTSAEMEAVLPLSSVDGSTVLARWEDPESCSVVVSSDIPPYARAVAEGALLTVLAAEQRQVACLLPLCGQLLSAGQLLRLWYTGEELRCFVAAPTYEPALRALWGELQRR